MIHNEMKIRNYKINATDDELGSVDAFLFDDKDWTIRYLLADTRKWLPGRKVLISPISIKTVNHEEEQVSVQLTKKQVKDSPDIDSDKPVTRTEELKINQFYGWGNYWGALGVWGSSMYPLYLMDETPDQQLLEMEEDLEQSHLRKTSEVQGYDINAKDGKIGHVKSFLIDDETWNIRYIVIDTKSWGHGKDVLIAPAWINEVSWTDKSVHVPFDKESVKDAPEFDPDAPLSRAYEEKLYSFYGKQPYWKA